MGRRAAPRTRGNSAYMKTVAHCIAQRRNLFDSVTCERQVEQAIEAIVRSFKSGGRVLLFGNGGSAAQAQHIAAEFSGRFMLERPSWAGLSLTTDTSALTAIANDYGYDQVFARQLRAHGRPGDIAIVGPSGPSWMVQEVHLALGHIMCELVELAMTRSKS